MDALWYLIFIGAVFPGTTGELFAKVIGPCRKALGKADGKAERSNNSDLKAAFMAGWLTNARDCEHPESADFIAHQRAQDWEDYADMGNALYLKLLLSRARDEDA